MGASSAREKLESKMLKLKLRRVEIKQERIERVKQLEKLTGKEIIRESMPDYIDHRPSQFFTSSAVLISSASTFLAPLTYSSSFSAVLPMPPPPDVAKA